MKTVVRIVMSGLILALIAGAVFAGPVMEIPDSTFNFGNVPQNAKVSHTFWLYSKGDDTLKIEKIVPG